MCSSDLSFAVDELLRINEVPEKLYYDENSAAFMYKGDRWLRSTLFATDWPDVSKFFTDEQLDEVPAGLLEAVQKILPFCPNPKFPIICLNEDGVSTEEGDQCASMDLAELPVSKYRAEPLLLALSYATGLDLSKYPAPVPFVGQNGLQGVLMGVN